MQKRQKSKEKLDYKNALRYLRRVESIDNMIAEKQEQIDSLRALASSTALHSDSERVQSSGGKDIVGECCAKIADLCAEINKDIDEFVDEKANVIHIIDKLDNLEERKLLCCRYLKYMPFSSIAKEMHISESTVYRMHKRSMERLEEMLKVDSP